MLKRIPKTSMAKNGHLKGACFLAEKLVLIGRDVGGDEAGTCILACCRKHYMLHVSSSW